MNKFCKRLVGAAVALCALGAISTASAADLIVTDVGVDSWNMVDVAGHGAEVSTAILFNGFVVFCVDLEHNVAVGGGQSLPYDFALLTVDGAGNPVSEANSNRIGRLADLGRFIYATVLPSVSRSSDLTAIQAAIWSIEYNTAVTSADSYTNGKIADYLLVTDNGRGRAHILQSLDGHQSQTIGGVPEPATWALMICGFGLAGAVLRRRPVLAGA
jgi:hypothetical protein